MSHKLKNYVVFIKIIIHFILCRSFGKILHDIAQKYDTDFTVSDLRKFEKLHLKINKATLDINFLFNCRNLRIYPKFIQFHIPNTINQQDTYFIRKRLLRSAINKRWKEKRQINKDLKEVENEIRSKISTIDWFILNQAVKKNVIKEEERNMKTHTKKLKNLSQGSITPFTHNEIVTNLSKTKLTGDELDILKYGLQYSIPPLKLNKTNIFTSFEMMHRFLKEELKMETDSGKLIAVCEMG